MGEHKGWLIDELPNGKLIARVKVPGGTGKYKSKTFAGDQRRAATKWAQDFAASIRLDVPLPGSEHQALTAELVRDFVAKLESLGRAPSHTKDIARNLQRMAVAVPNLAAPAARAQFETWLDGLRSASEVDGAGKPLPLAPATRNKVLAEARALTAWAMRKGRLTRDPTAGVERAFVPSRLPPAFSVAEIRRALTESEDPYHRLFAVMIYTGFRVQEASNLHWEDIDWSGDCILLRLRPGVRIKGMKERMVPLQEELRAILEMPWPATRRRATKTRMRVDGTPAQQRTGALFAGRGFNPFRGMANFLTRCGIPIEDRSPHSCRHTFAGLMSAAGLSLDLLRSYMGHTDVATTTIYTELAPRYETVARSWPRGRLQIMQGWAAPIRAAT